MTVVSGAGDEHYLEKSLGHVSAWLLDTRTANDWNKGMSVCLSDCLTVCHEKLHMDHPTFI